MFHVNAVVAAKKNEEEEDCPSDDEEINEAQIATYFEDHVMADITHDR